MRQVYIVVCSLFILSFINNFLLTIDCYYGVIEKININGYLNTISGNSLAEYLEAILVNIFYFLFYFDISDLKTVNEVMLCAM